MKGDTFFKIMVIGIALIQISNCLHLGDFLPYGNLKPGNGYYSDAGVFATTRVCFNPKNVTKIQQNEVYNFDPKSVQEFLEEIDPQKNMFTGVNLFKDDYNFLLEKNSKTYSLFIYSKVSQIVNVEYDDKDILSKEGVVIKDKSPANFRFICGDSIVSQYEEGGIILLNISFVFNKAEDIHRIFKSINLKQKLPQLIASFSKTAQNLKIEGKIKMEAKQFGGDTFNIGEFSGSSCDFKNDNECSQLVDSVTKYIKVDFPKGFKKDSKGIYTFNTVPLFKFKLYKNVSDLGIDLGKSFLTQEVKDARVILETEYKKLKMAAVDLNKIINDYPVPLGPQFTKLSERASYQLAYFTDTKQMLKPSLCYSNNFDKCEKSKNYVLGKLDKGLIEEIKQKVYPLRIFAKFEINLTGNMCLRSKTHKTPLNYIVSIYNTNPIASAVSELITSRIVKFNGFDRFTISASAPDRELLQYFDFETIVSDDGKTLIGTLTCSGEEEFKSQNLIVTGELMELTGLSNFQ